MRTIEIPRLVRAAATALMCAGMSLLTMCGEPGAATGSQSALGLRASLAFAPLYPAGVATALHAAAIEIDNVHIVLRRADGSVSLDTTIAFPAGVDEVTLEASVLLHGVSEQFAATIQLRTGGMVLFEGTQQISARAGITSAQPVAIPIHYSGPGSTATKVAISQKTLSLLPGQQRSCRP